MRPRPRGDAFAAKIEEWVDRSRGKIRADVADQRLLAMGYRDSPAAEWPSRWFVPPELDDDQRPSRLALQLCTLRVGMSRARDRLDLLTGGKPCAPAERAAWALERRGY